MLVSMVLAAIPVCKLSLEPLKSPIEYHFKTTFHIFLGFLKNDLKRQKAQEKVSKIYTIYYILISRRDLFNVRVFLP